MLDTYELSHFHTGAIFILCRRRFVPMTWNNSILVWPTYNILILYARCFRPIIPKISRYIFEIRFFFIWLPTHEQEESYFCGLLHQNRRTQASRCEGFCMRISRRLVSHMLTMTFVTFFKNGRLGLKFDTLQAFTQMLDAKHIGNPFQDADNWMLNVARHPDVVMAERASTTNVDIVLERMVLATLFMGRH